MMPLDWGGVSEILSVAVANGMIDFEHFLLASKGSSNVARSRNRIAIIATWGKS
jgi:hypothetical protein